MDSNLSRAEQIAAKGQGLVAKSDLSPGDVIIRINEPYMVRWQHSKAYTGPCKFETLKGKMILSTFGVKLR
jgi:hypothetical protein